MRFTCAQIVLLMVTLQGKGKREALKQQSIKYHHMLFAHPTKRFFQEIWQGRQWLEQSYDPARYWFYAE